MIVAAATAYRLSEQQEGFQVIRGTVGGLTRYDHGLAGVSDVRVGTELRQGTARVRTSGMFVVVRLTVQAPGSEKVRFSNAQLLSRDTTYTDFTDASTVSADAGFETARDVAFEVAPGRVQDLTIQAWGTGLVSGYHQRLRVHLGITGDNAEEWVAAAQGNHVRLDSDPITRGLR